METRQIDEVSPRLETGPLRAGPDWPGVFIRGDNAQAFLISLQTVMARARETNVNTELFFALGQLRDLEEILQSAILP